MPKRKNRAYSKEFKESSVKLVLNSSENIKEVSDNLGIPEGTLRDWVKKSSSTSDNIDNTYKELIRLKKELNQVKQERDILKKAAAYFARESR